MNITFTKKPKTMNNSTFKITIIENIDNPFIDEWKELWDSSINKNIFNSPEWFLSCIEAFSINNYQIYAGYENGKLAATFPLIKKSLFGINTSQSICNGLISDTPFLVKNYNDDLLTNFFKPLLSSNNIFISMIDSEVARLLHNDFPKAFFSLISANPVLKLEDNPLRYISKSNRKNLKKTLNKYEDDLECRLVCSEQDIQDYLHVMFEIEYNSVKRSRHTDMFSEPEIRILFQKISKYLSKYTRIYFLLHKNIPIAYQFGFINRNTFLAYQTAYLSEFNKLDPGKVLLVNLLEIIKSNECHEFDFGCGMSSYKRELTPNYKVFYNLYSSNNLIILYWWELINCIRRVKQILFHHKFSDDYKYLFRTIGPKSLRINMLNIPIMI
ncbi:MAG: GNAT family N-acetyltransferase [Parachlamydiales bacterium]|jgi:hypothetical protein